MNVAELVLDLAVLERRGASTAEVRQIGSDSRAVGPGSVFTAIAGSQVDGHSFVPQALDAGASVVLLQRWPTDRPWPAGVLGLRVADPRRAQAILAHRLHGSPSAQMRAFAVTGTNGKTTTTYLLRDILASAGYRAACLGTTGCAWTSRDGEARHRVLQHTTPDGPELMALLAELHHEGVEAVALELSSHALHQGRAAGLRLDAAGWTNLSRDHLDYHGTMEAYEAAKALLLREWLPSWGKPGATAVLCVDDPAPARHEGDGARVLSVSVHPMSDAGLRPVALARMDLSGIAVDLRWGTTVLSIRSPLVGAHNLQNLMVAAGMALAAGVPPGAVVEGLSRSRGAPGRLEPVRAAGGGPIVFVDYAHTDDALAQVLAVLRPQTRGRLWVVFGCGGDRDRGKRPLMGLRAWEGADIVVATSDNPRSEDPERILDEALSALPKDATSPGGRVFRIPERAAAIRLATLRADPDDVVLIAGKGHETTQDVGGVRHPFDDRLHAAAALESRA